MMIDSGLLFWATLCVGLHNLQSNLVKLFYLFLLLLLYYHCTVKQRCSIFQAVNHQQPSCPGCRRPLRWNAMDGMQYSLRIIH